MANNPRSGFRVAVHTGPRNNPSPALGTALVATLNEASAYVLATASATLGTVHASDDAGDLFIWATATPGLITYTGNTPVEFSPTDGHYVAVLSERHTLSPWVIDTNA